MPPEFDAVIDASGFHWLPISRAHADRTAALADPHRDPFDRMLAAQAQCDDLTLLTVDARLAAYGRHMLWINPS